MILPDCGASFEGRHTWTQNFMEIDTFNGSGRLPVGWRCIHCGIAATDPEGIEYQQLLDSVISEAMKEVD